MVCALAVSFAAGILIVCNRERQLYALSLCLHGLYLQLTAIQSSYLAMRLRKTRGTHVQFLRSKVIKSHRSLETGRSHGLYCFLCTRLLLISVFADCECGGCWLNVVDCSQRSLNVTVGRRRRCATILPHCRHPVLASVGSYRSSNLAAVLYVGGLVGVRRGIGPLP